MHHGRHIFAVALSLLISGCASLGTSKSEPQLRNGLSPRKLSSGECGLFVWKADQAKTFILFADNKSAAFYLDGREVALTRAPSDDIPDKLNFLDSSGQNISLILLDAHSFQDSTRYKSGRLTSLDNNGWEIVTPVVGLYSCKT